jgi:Flp pilus assembly protein TadG
MNRTAVHKRRRQGVAAAEMAILLPFLALLFGAALDFCRIFYTSQTIANCAHSAALYASGAASMRTDLASPAAAAQDAALAEGVSLNPPLQPANITTTLSNGMATVTISYDFPLLMPFLGKSITITRTVTMEAIAAAPWINSGGSGSGGSGSGGSGSGGSGGSDDD